MLVGAVFTLIAAIGLLRLPDLFMRMHANTKSATLGVGFIMIGVAIYFGEITVTTRAMAVVIFLFITAPISSHLLARAAYFSGIPLWDQTLSDDLRGHYDTKTHELHGEPLETDIAETQSIQADPEVS
jgi:multicomponent Na+:H+ antiporter subunit G